MHDGKRENRLMAFSLSSLTAICKVIRVICLLLAALAVGDGSLWFRKRKPPTHELICHNQGIGSKAGSIVCSRPY